MDNFDSILNKLIKIPLFSAFNPDNENDRRILRIVYENISVEKYAKGNCIIREGDKGDKFFILYDGRIQICRKTPAGDSIALADLGSDENIFFGETALVSDEPRTASVIASTECTCVVFSCKKFMSLCEAEPLLGYRVLLVLANDMSQTISRMNNDKALLYEALCGEIASGV